MFRQCSGTAAIIHLIFLLQIRVPEKISSFIYENISLRPLIFFMRMLCIFCDIFGIGYQNHKCVRNKDLSSIVR